MPQLGWSSSVSMLKMASSAKGSVMGYNHWSFLLNNLQLPTPLLISAWHRQYQLASKRCYRANLPDKAGFQVYALIDPFRRLTVWCGTLYNGPESLLPILKHNRFSPKWNNGIHSQHISCPSNKLLVLSYPSHHVCLTRNPYTSRGLPSTLGRTTRHWRH